jgi:predicted transcriptional regulator
MPRTKIEMKGNLRPEIIGLVTKLYKKNVKIFNDDGEEIELATETDWFKNIDSKTTPGEVIKIYRENFNLSQTQLGEKLSKSGRYISDLENNRRSVSLNLAKQLSKIFDISIERFF